MFKLSTPVTSPAGDEEDSIAKVLDWFSRSTDSNDWLNREDGVLYHIVDFNSLPQGIEIKIQDSLVFNRQDVVDTVK